MNADPVTYWGTLPLAWKTHPYGPSFFPKLWSLSRVAHWCIIVCQHPQSVNRPHVCACGKSHALETSQTKAEARPIVKVHQCDQGWLFRLLCGLHSTDEADAYDWTRPSGMYLTVHQTISLL